MALTNRPKKSLYQVGETVYFLNAGKGTSAEVVKISSVVSNPAENNTGLQENIYFLDKYSNEFKETELFHSMNALMFNVKGGYLSNTVSLVLESGNNDLGFVDFSYTNFQGSQFSGCYFPNSDFEGAQFSNVNFTSSNISGANMKRTTLNNSLFVLTNLQEVNLDEANLNGSDFRGADLTGAQMPSNANTKSLFKATVGEGHWDPDTTIWIDGLPIGN